MKQNIIICLLIIFLLSACQSQSSPTPVNRSNVHPELKNIPVYPESTAWSEGIPDVNRQEELQTYSYIANVSEYETLVEFYEDKMSSDGWELLEKSVHSKTKSAGLMFTRSKTVAHIQMIPWTANSYLVYVVFYDG